MRVVNEGSSWLAALLVPLAMGCASPPMPKASQESPRPTPVLPSTSPASSARLCPWEPHMPPASGEGMWPWNRLAQLDEASLRARGLRVPLASLWTPGRGGLLRAVAGLRGCSASFVSDQGLLLTNHHCAHQAIQRNSTPEHNYLQDGFLAASRALELPGRGMTALVFSNQTDVTERVLGGMPSASSDYERIRFIERRESALVRACEGKPNTRCSVARENNGLRFVLLENLELRDVRLVAAPPSSLASFGGEIDNWHWPRQSLDFTLMRAYVAPDGTPAEYDARNVPYRPEVALRVSAQPQRPDDFVMIVGKPVSTDRYATSEEVRDVESWLYPVRAGLFAAWIEELEHESARDPRAAMATASWIRRLNNGLFHAKGMVEGLRRNDVVAGRLAQEQAWRGWIAADAGRQAQWGDSLDALLDHVRKARDHRDPDLLLKQASRGVQLLAFARTITKWAAEREKPDEERLPGFQDRDAASLLRDLEQAQRSLHSGADERVFRLFARRVCQLPEESRPAQFGPRGVVPCQPNALDRFAKTLYARSSLGLAEQRSKLFDTKLADLRKSRDPMIQLALDLMPLLDAIEHREKERQGARIEVQRPYLASWGAFRGRTFYPDANDTPRISFAHVGGYAPRDGVWHSPFTGLRGWVDKHTGQEPFDAPEPVRKAVQERRWGGYEDDALGDVPLCFLANGDTTGGNSGSPVLDGEARLVGLNFDRVYENIAGDYGYEPERSRNIMVSASAILWYLETIAGAQAVVQELLRQQ